jgi:hypothetical protein
MGKHLRPEQQVVNKKNRGDTHQDCQEYIFEIDLCRRVKRGPRLSEFSFPYCRIFESIIPPQIWLSAAGAADARNREVMIKNRTFFITWLCSFAS